MKSLKTPSAARSDFTHSNRMPVLDVSLAPMQSDRAFVRLSLSDQTRRAHRQKTVFDQVTLHRTKELAL